MFFPEFSKKKMVHFPQILKLSKIHSHALNFLSAKDVHVKKSCSRVTWTHSSFQLNFTFCTKYKLVLLPRTQVGISIHEVMFINDALRSYWSQLLSYSMRN